jgi:flagellar biosynthesis GTPase FlhF
MWQMVAELHALNFPHCNRDAKSLQRKYLKHANEQPGSGNPSMSRATLLAKEIKEAINVKAGVNNPDLTDFFAEDGIAVGDDVDDFDDDTGLDATPIPDAVVMNTEARRDSEPSMLSSLVGKQPSSTGSKPKKTRTNLLVSAVEDSNSGTAAAISSIMQQRQMSEETEWRFKRMEREEEFRRREEEREEMRRKREEAEEERRREREEERRRREEEREEDRRRREEEREERRRRDEEREEERRRREEELHQQRLRMDRMMELAIGGLFTYMGTRVPPKRNKDDE